MSKINFGVEQVSEWIVAVVNHEKGISAEYVRAALNFYQEHLDAQDAQGKVWSKENE